jgi:hypothetical protein
MITKTIIILTLGLVAAMVIIQHMHVYALSKIPDSVVSALNRLDNKATILHGYNSPQEQITSADDELVYCINQYLHNKTNSFQDTCDHTLSLIYSSGNFNHTVTVSGLGNNITNMSQLANEYFKARGIL